MNRRTFLKRAALATLTLKYTLTHAGSAWAITVEPIRKGFESFKVSGTYSQIGFQIGRRFSKNIHEIIHRRSEWHLKLLAILNSKKGRALSNELLANTRTHFPHILEEIRGMADGSRIRFDNLWAMSIKSELLSLRADTPGCSSIFYKDTNNMWLFHNEDGHSAYRDLMFIVKVKPPSGVGFISMVYPGIITGNGPSLNDRGIVQTTNYIGSTRCETGIPRYVIGRAILEARDTKEAIDIATMEPRAYPYHHNIGSIDERKYFSIETTPEAAQVKEPTGQYFHTNHLLFDGTRRYKFEDREYTSTSSMSRYEVIEERLNDANDPPAEPDDFLEILSSHQNAPYSPCRHPEGNIHGATLGTAFIDLKKGTFRLYCGNPCKAVGDRLYIDFKL